MELRVLRYFLAVAKEESISGAANYLHLSQPSLSRQLMELERELGKTLFLRGNRKITLTEDGELLRQRATEILTLVENTEAAFRDSTEEITGEVYIGGGETQAMRLIASCAQAVAQAYPAVRYHLYSGNADDVMERLDRGVLDFGLMIEPFDRRKYHFLKLPVTDTWGVLMRKDSPLAAHAFVRTEELWDLPLLISAQSRVLSELPAWIGKPLEELHVVGTYNLLFNASLMVSEGMGYALCLDRLVQTDANSDLCFRPLFPERKVGICVVWKKYRVFSRAAQKFLEQLQQLYDS